MTRAELYTLTTSFTGGVEIDESLFESLLDVAQIQYEGLRPWVILRKEDLTQTVDPSTTFTTAKTLPADFKEWFEESPVQLIDVNNNIIYLTEVPYSDRYHYQKLSAKFCVDYPTNRLFIVGNLTQNYTIKQSYIPIPTLVSSSASATWVFPSRFHQILALMVAIYWRKGVDYDIFNQTLADNQIQQAQTIYDIMSRWDANLQQNMQRGKDPFNSNSIGAGNQSGGFVQQ